MKICPQCHDEYRDDIKTCLSCHIELEQTFAGAPQRPRVVEEVDLSTAVKVFEGTLEACKEIDALLKREKVACALVAVGAIDEPRLGRPKEMGARLTTYALCVNADKVATYAAVMKARFDGMVEREHSKEFILHDVNLDHEEVTCPACGHVGALVDGACADCGLMLGVSEPQ